MGNVLWFLWCTWCNLEYRTLNENYLVIQSHLWTYYFEFTVFALLCNIFPGVMSTQVLTNNIKFELFKSDLCKKLRKNLCGSFVSLFYEKNNQLIMFFISCSAKNSLCFMLYQFHSLESLPTSLGKWK